MKRKIIRVVVSFLALVPFVQPGLAVAAPQTLGFVATNGPVELKCEAGHCKAEFSSFCLQEKHGPPTKGTPYFAIDTRSIQVTASRSDGRQISLSPAMDFTMTARINTNGSSNFNVELVHIYQKFCVWTKL